jgi:hypothetical protein
LIGRLIQTLSSPEVAIDDRHTPKLHAKFLAGLLTKHQGDAAARGRRHQNPAPGQTYMHGPYGAVNPSGSSSQVFSVAPQVQRGGAGAGAGGAGSTSASSSSLEQDDGTASRPFGNADSTAQNGELAVNGDSYCSHLEHDMTFRGPVEVGAGGSGVGASNDWSGEEMLAALQALRNPNWWNNMMMPGYVLARLLVAFWLMFFCGD